MFGAQNAAQLNRLADKTADIVSYRIGENDKAFARDALNKWDDDVRKKVYGEYMTLQGEQTKTLDVDADKFMAQTAESYLKTLQTPLQRQLFKASIDAHRSSYMDRLTAFKSAEMQKFAVQTLDGENFNAMQKFIQDPTAENAVEMKGKITLNTAYKYKGLGELAKAETATALDKAYTGALDSIQSGRSASDALAFLQSNKANFLPSTYADREVKLIDLAQKEQGLRKAAGLHGTGMSLDIQLAEANKIENPNEREAAITEVNRLHTIGEAKKVQETSLKTASYWDNFWSNGKIDPSAPADIQQAMRKSQERAAMAAVGKEINTDRPTYYKLTLMGDSEFRNLNLLEYQSLLSDGDFKEMVKRQNDLAQGKKTENEFSPAMKIADDYMQASPGLNTFQTKDAFGKTDANKQVKVERRRNEFLTVFDSRLRRLPADKRNDREAVMKILYDMEQPTNVSGAAGQSDYGDQRWLRKWQVEYLNSGTKPLSDNDTPSALKGLEGLRYLPEQDVFAQPIKGTDNLFYLYERNGKRYKNKEGKDTFQIEGLD